MSPRALITRDKRITFTLGACVAAILFIVGGVGAVYQAKASIKEEIRLVQTENKDAIAAVAVSSAKLNADQDKVIAVLQERLEVMARTSEEIKADVKTLLQRRNP